MKLKVVNLSSCYLPYINDVVALFLILRTLVKIRFSEGWLVTLHTLVFTHIKSVVKPVHIFMARSRVSRSHLKVELCFHRYVHFACVPIYVFGLHHKQCASS